MIQFELVKINLLLFLLKDVEVVTIENKRFQEVSRDDLNLFQIA